MYDYFDIQYKKDLAEELSQKQLKDLDLALDRCRGRQIKKEKKKNESTESPKKEEVVPKKKRGKLTAMERCLDRENPGVFIDYCRSPNNKTELDALYDEKDDCSVMRRTPYILFCFNRKLAELRKEGSLIPNHTKTHKPNHKDDSTYIGEVDQELKACGYGVSVMGNGKTYEGTFFNDVFEGVITIKVDNKVKGVQEYKNGKAYGLGTYYGCRPGREESDDEGEETCYNVCPGFPKRFTMRVKTEKEMEEYRESINYES